MATRHSGRRGPVASQITAAALLEVFKEHPKGRTFASHLAPGGVLRSLCEAAQRGHGLPVGQMAQHFLAARGHSNVFNAVATFNNLVKGGHQPHKWGLGSIGHFVSSHASSAIGSVTRTVNNATNSVSSFAGAVGKTVGAGMSSFANRGMDASRNLWGSFRGAVAVGSRVGRAYDRASDFARGAYGSGSNAFHSMSSSISSRGHALWNAARRSGQDAWGGMKQFGQDPWGHIRQGGQALGNVARGGFNALSDGASWAQRKAGATYDRARQSAGGAFDWARQRASGASHWLGDQVHSGLEWAKKTGVVGGLGTGLRAGVSFMKKAAGYTPLGLAVKAGKWAAGGGLGKVWNNTKSMAGQAFAGVKSAYKATAGFLQSPAGQLLVTGLSLAASFIPGGIIVKAIIGGGIGAIQAISEGKDWKGILAGTAGGALTGALPFLKMGPLAKMGIGALTGGITTLAQGGSLKDALKGAAGGAVDSFDPGAFKALSRLKGLTAAEKLLKGKNLSKAEKAFMEGSKFAGPLRELEKAMANPKTARMVGGLERAGSKTVKGGIWVSGKAAKAQGALDKVVGAGDKVHGVLTQVHDLAPGLANILGDNPAGHFVGNVGDWAGKGDEKLSKALEYGHTASDQMTTYRGYLDKGLGSVGVKHPSKAYEKMMARKDLAAGKKGGLEHVARLKLDDHQRKHPELHLAAATGKRTRGAHGEAPSPRRRAGGTTADHSPSSRKSWYAGGTSTGNKHTRLEQALAKGRGLIKTGQRVAHGVHGGLGQVQDVIARGLDGAQKAQADLKQAAELAKAGAGILGDDSELGKYLLEVSSKADQAHVYLQQGIGFAEEFNKGVGKAHDLTGKIHGFDDGSPLQRATYLQHGKSPHQTRPHGGKTPGVPGPEHAHAWDKIGYLSGAVQKFESRHAQVQRKIQEMLGKGQGNAASIELMGLGSECDQISKAINEARTLAKGSDKYGKEIAFYEEWHKKTRAQLHAAIADTKGLGGQVAISGFGISEQTHPDIFENTKGIYAVRTKVQAFGEALHDHDAAAQVRKLLDEAKKAKADLARLKSKYQGDKAAARFLTGGGEQDRLIDESIQKLEAALKGEGKKSAPGKTAPGKSDVHGKKKPGEHLKSAEGGLRAIEKYRRKAAKAGKKVDASLGKMEHALGQGLRIGRKVDGGLAKIAGVADQLSKALGEDSELGHFAQQVSGAAGKGHEKLHDALHVAGQGKRGLHKGRELFEQGLKIAAGHHEGKLEKIHGKKKANAEHEHGGTHGAELVRHATAHDHHQRSPHGGLFNGLEHVIVEGKHLLGEIGGKTSPHDGPRPGHHRHHHHRKHHGPGPQPAPQQGGGAGFSEADIAQVVQGAMQWVTGFGKAVTAAIRDIEKLMSAGKTKEAGDRVQAVSLTSEQTRFEVTRAVSTSAKYPALHKQAQSASKHYLEIRKHLFTFVKGLHGLGGQTIELEGVDGKKYPDLLALSTDLGSLQVKVDALGELKHADTPMQGPADELKKEAAGLRARVSTARPLHKGDPAAAQVIEGLSAKLQQIERQLGAHSDKGNTSQGDKDLGIQGKAPRPQHKPRNKPHHRRRHPGHDPIGDILNGEDGRINIDRGGARGDMDVYDGQDVDPAAADTWIGSGEGIKLFSEVFGAFIPAEGAFVQHHAGGGGSQEVRGGEVVGPHGHLTPGGHGMGWILDGEEHGPVGPHHRRRKRKGMMPKRISGFFHGLFEHLHQFSDRIAGWAEQGASLLGKGMHYAEMGMHGMSAIEKAAEKVQGIAGKAEGFLGKMGLGKLAGFAGKIGGAAGWVDKESKLLHGGLKTADKWMGKGKRMAGQVDGVARKAGGVFDQGEHGRFGSLLNLFKSAKNGDGIDGRLVPEKMRLGSQFDEPRRLDLMTMSRMEGFLGGDFAGVRIHTGPGAAQVTNRFAAEAVTVKDHIFFAPGRFNPSTTEGQRLLAHELTHVMQKGRPNLDVRTAESEALHSEHSYGYGKPGYGQPQMETLNLSQPAPDFRLGDGEGLGNASGVHTAKRNRSKGHEAGGKDTLPDGEEFIEQISNRVYELLMEELEHAFESR